MGEPPQGFPAMFAALVGPDLRKRCRYWGSQMALDLVGFEEAVLIVWAEARRRGVLRLPADKCEQLEDWIATLVLEAEDEFRPSVIAHREVVDRVVEDIARTEAKWLGMEELQ